MFTIPFVIFGSWAGHLADRFAKSKIMTVVKLCEIAIMLVGCFAFWGNQIGLLLFVLFLMASHSAFFSPAKSGFIPETCPSTLVAKANGIVGMSTFFSIIAGTALAGLSLEFCQNDSFRTSLLSLVLAILGFVSSRFMTPTTRQNSNVALNFNPIKGFFVDIRFLFLQKNLFLIALANSFFWFLGFLFQTNILVYGIKAIGINPLHSGQLSLLPAVMGIGISTGSLIAGSFAKHNRDLRPAKLGLAGLALISLLLGLLPLDYKTTLIFVTLGGICGGLYIIPLNIYLQTATKSDEKGRILATAGMLNGIFLVAAASLYRILVVDCGVSSIILFVVMGAVSLMAFLGLLKACRSNDLEKSEFPPF